MGDHLLVTVPCELRYRDAVGVMVQHLCQQLERTHNETALVFQVVSAFNEAFNNAVEFAGVPPGDIEVAIEVQADRLVIEIRDCGKSFDFDAVESPDLHDLPETGLGIFIIRSFMSEVRYEPKGSGERNVLRMTRLLQPRQVSAGAAPEQGTSRDA